MVSVLLPMFKFGHFYSHFKMEKISGTLLKNTFSILMTKKKFKKVQSSSVKGTHKRKKNLNFLSSEMANNS